MRTASPTQDRADVDHNRLHAFAQHRDCFADEFDRCEEVYFHDWTHAFGARVGESAMRGHARVVDQDVEAAELVVSRRECSLSNCPVSHITNDANGPPTKPRDLLCD